MIARLTTLSLHSRRHSSASYSNRSSFKSPSHYYALIIRPPDHSRQVLCFTAVLFFKHYTFNLRALAVAPRQKCISGSVLGWTWKLRSAISPIAHLIFTGGEKVRNLASIFDHSHLWRALVSKRRNASETILWVPIICLCPPQIWCSSVQSSSRSIVSTICSLENERKISAKSSIIQPCIAPLCWNLICWCITRPLTSRNCENSLPIKFKMAKGAQIALI